MKPSTAFGIAAVLILAASIIGLFTGAQDKHWAPLFMVGCIITAIFMKVARLEDERSKLSGYTRKQIEQQIIDSYK